MDYKGPTELLRITVEWKGRFVVLDLSDVESIVVLRSLVTIRFVKSLVNRKDNNKE